MTRSTRPKHGPVPQGGCCLRLMVFVVLCLVAATNAVSATLWEEDGFKLEVVKHPWLNDDHIRDWTGIRCGVTLPDDGWVYFMDTGSVEVFLPCKDKWVADVGIVVSTGCVLDPGNVRDTRGGGIVLTAEDRCSAEGNRIKILILVPKLLGTNDCYPTSARWVQTKVDYDAEN